ncbi:MAG: hypothetical protein IJK03_04695, partial [Oscillospiraceae bacterium]|nr:hypothetical protein [Oscillospiraceae bacterium]
MIKKWISGRQFLCLLLVFAFMLALLGCAQPAEAASAAGAAEEKTGAPEAAVPGFFLTAEYDRLYFAPLDGSSPRLVADSSTLCTARWGEWLYAAFEDGSIMRLSQDGSSVTELVPAGSRNYRELIPFDGGVIGAHYSLREGAGYDLYREGSRTPVALFEGEPALMTCTVGKYIYSRRYDGVSGSRLVAFDPESLECL